MSVQCQQMEMYICYLIVIIKNIVSQQHTQYMNISFFNVKIGTERRSCGSNWNQPLIIELQLQRWHIEKVATDLVHSEFQTCQEDRSSDNQASQLSSHIDQKLHMCLYTLHDHSQI